MPLDKFLESFDPSAEGFDADAFKTKALEEYKADLESRDSKIADITNDRDSLSAKVTKLGAANYDLVQQLGIPVSGGGAPGAAGDGGAPQRRPIESLFKKPASSAEPKE